MRGEWKVNFNYMKEDKLNNDVSNQIPNSCNTQLKYQILLDSQIALEHRTI